MATLIKRGKVYYSYFKVNKKRICKALDSDKTQAQIKLNRMVEEMQFKRRGLPDSSYFAFKGSYMKMREEMGKSKSTLWHDRHAFKMLEETFPELKNISELTPNLMRSFVGKMLSQGRGNAAINRYMESLLQVVKEAERLKITDSHNWRTVKKLKQSKGKLRWYTIHQANQILESCKRNRAYLTGAYLALNCGLRLSELYWLPWEHVHMESGILEVAPYQEFRPKDHECRYIPMPEHLMEYLNALPREGPYVLGKRPSFKSMTPYYRYLIAQAGQQGSVHTFRHTYVSHLVQKGAELHEVQTLLGHSSPSTTKIYAHLRPDGLKSVVKMLPKFVAPACSPCA